LSDEEKVRELVERIHRLAVKEQEVDAQMKKLERLLARKIEHAA
jgi:hypothetical protein